MKTNSSIRKSLGTVLLISTVLMSNYFTSCENFLKGSEIVDSINSAIEYANAESYIIRISADDETGTITTGAGDRDLKVTDTINVGFKVSPRYKFVRWEAVKKSDESVLMSDYVEFEDKTALETKVKLVKKSDDLLIKPLCELSMDFTSCIPVNNTKSGIERNSQIELTFTNPLSTENDVSKIQILIEDDKGDVENGALYFQPTVITENKIIIKSVKDNLIPVQQGELKTVTIVIPEDFKYIGANNEEKFIGFEMSYSYTVNYQTCDKLHVVFGLEEHDGGKFRIQNMNDESLSFNYSLGQMDTIIFKPSADYRFLNWEYAKDGHLLVDEKLNDVINNLTYVDGYCKEDNSYAAKIEIFNSSNEDTNFLFKAKVEKIPTAQFQITSKFGRISPNGKFTYKEGDDVNLFFTADPDYQFIRWRLINGNTGKEIDNQEYVKFENEKEFNTSFTFQKVPENNNFLLVVEAECAKRPKVVSATPMYDSDGVYRDRRIVVMFDNEMDDSSIYFNEEELKELLILRDGEDFNTEVLRSGYTLLKDSKHGNKCYGYYKESDSNSYVYKNIQITRRTNVNENLLQYYDAPCFDENDSSKIIIESLKTNSPPGGVEILVSISGNMNCTKGTESHKTQISIGSMYIWSYYTNGREDSDPPVFNTIDVRFAKKNQTQFDSSALQLAEDVLAISNNPKDGIPKYNHKQRKLWVKGDFTDSGSGPASLKWSITKINDKYYPSNSNIEVLSGKVEGDDYYQEGKNKVIIGGLSGLESKGIFIDYEKAVTEEGLYRFSLTAADNNGCTNTRNYYFVYDQTPPEASKVYIGAVGKKRFRINYTVSECVDYAYLEISGPTSRILESGVKGNEYYEEITLGEGNSFKNIYCIQNVDFAGNKSEPVNITPNGTDVKNGMICYKSNSDNKAENLFFCFDYVNDMTPIGVVCDDSDTSKIKIWDLTEVTGWNWGRDAKPCSDQMGSYGSSYFWDGRNHADGLTWYNLILKDYYSLSTDKINGHYTIWNWLRVWKNKDTPVTWYIPGIFEYESIIKNYSVMQNSYTLLNNNGHSTTLFTQQQPYWTGVPRYKSGYANVVMLNNSNKGCEHELCKNGNNTLYITGDYKESGLYYKDELMNNPITHAMAQVNLNN